MLSKTMQAAAEYVKELEKRRAAYQEFTKKAVPELFRKEKQRRRKPPKDFNDSSFLYIRSYDADIGVRPFSGITFWNSPDITVAPVTDTTAYTRTLEAGKAYRFSCTVRNRGDLIVPSTNVEFFLCTPSLGFDTRFATRLGATSAWVNSLSATTAGINYQIPGTEGGHKCLFARAFSFSPLDLPFSDYQLIPTQDRHVGQLNLDITPQSSAYQFQLIHLPNAGEHLMLMPMTEAEMLALRHPFLADFKPVRKATAALMRKMVIAPAEQKEQDKTLQRDNKGWTFSSKSREGVPLRSQGPILRATVAAVKAINSGKAKPAEFREVFQRLRDMNKPMQRTLFNLQIPDFGLQRGEAVGINIVATNLVNGEIKGGITLIVTG